MIKISDLSNWHIQFQGLTFNETPVEYTKTEEAITFNVQLNGTEEIKFEFPLQKEGLSLQGKYHLSPSNYTSTAFIKVIEEGHRMQVTLQGNLSRFSFQLIRP